MLLKINNMSKYFKRRGVSFPAADNVNLSVDAGDFVIITGPSGNGKSTLLNIAAGLLKPDSGNVLFENRDIFSLSDGEISRLRNSKIGYVPQGQSILSSLTVLDNIRLPFYLFKREGEPEKRAMLLLEKLGISDLYDSFPSQLSGGELRRVAIARALINSPPVIIADEPTSDLDESTTKSIMKLFVQIREEGTAVLLVTHETDIKSYGGRTYTMNAGALTELTGL